MGAGDQQRRERPGALPRDAPPQVRRARVRQVPRAALRSRRRPMGDGQPGGRSPPPAPPEGLPPHPARLVRRRRRPLRRPLHPRRVGNGANDRRVSGPASPIPFWGELHTHSALSDGNGSAEECFAIARSHLDFWALTDHALDDQVFYIPPDAEFYKRRPPDGPVLNNHWPKIQELCRAYEAPGEFIPFLAYEWTNFRYGNHNVYYLDYGQPLRMPPTLPELYDALRGVEALVIPHHTGYPPGKCGKDWDYHDAALTPFVELYSLHGSSEEPGGIRPLLT